MESSQKEIGHLRGYIEELRDAHQKQIDGLLGFIREQGKQIAELRIEAGLEAREKSPFDAMFPEAFHQARRGG